MFVTVMFYKIQQLVCNTIHHLFEHFGMLSKTSVFIFSPRQTVVIVTFSVGAGQLLSTGFKINKY